MANCRLLNDWVRVLSSITALIVGAGVADCWGRVSLITKDRVASVFGYEEQRHQRNTLSSNACNESGK